MLDTYILDDVRRMYYEGLWIDDITRTINLRYGTNLHQYDVERLISTFVGEE
jgi:hypothetical protein